jgi:tRNA(adenine34) deaminase
MRLALEAARRAGLAGQPPVGACVSRSGQMIATGANAVVAELDVTAHAEIIAIRAACRELRSLDLAGCDLHTTVQPCPMCLAACHYAGVRRVVYGASLADMHAVTGRELMNDADYRTLAPGMCLTAGCLRSESVALLQDWSRRAPW